MENLIKRLKRKEKELEVKNNTLSLDNENLVNTEQNLIDKLKSLKRSLNICSKDLKTKESLVSIICGYYSLWGQIVW